MATTGHQSSRLTSRPTSGPPSRVCPAPSPRPRGLDKHRRGPAGCPQARRAGAAPPARGERPGSAPFLTDPNMASVAAARDDDTSPRRRRPGDRGGKRPESFASPLPARQEPPDNQPRLHLPGRAQKAAAEKVRLLLVPGAGRRLCLLPRPSLPGCAASGPAQPAQSGLRWPSAPPDETHNGRRSWPLPCARTGAPPPTRQARARARAHPHRSLSALSCLFPRPARAAPRDVLEGAGPPRRPHPPGQPGRGVGSSAPSGVVGPGADWVHVGRLTWVASRGQSLRKDCSSHQEGLSEAGRMEGKLGPLSPHHRTGLRGEFKNFPQPGNKSFGFKASGQTFVCYTHLARRSFPVTSSTCFP